MYFNLVCLFILVEGWPVFTCQVACVEVEGQLLGVRSLIPPHGHQGPSQFGRVGSKHLYLLSYCFGPCLSFSTLSFPLIFTVAPGM